MEKDILKVKDPFEIFSYKDCAFNKTKFRELALKYHPDHNPGDSEAEEKYKKISQLYEDAKEILKEYQWISSTRAKFIDADTAQIYMLRFRISREFELGRVFIGDHNVLYSIKPEYSKFYDNAIVSLSDKVIKYKNEKMTKEMSRFIPKIKKTFTDIKGNCNIMFEKTVDMLPLLEVSKYYGNNFDPRAIAWILSRLYNLANYFNYLKISHCGIDLANCFISPEFHSCVVFGGWWYVAGFGKKLKGMSCENYKILNNRGKIAVISIDLEHLKNVGRELLGGKIVNHPPNKLKLLVDWLRLPSLGHAYDDYKYYYNKVLPDTFGPPKFIKMELSADALYGHSSL